MRNRCAHVMMVAAGLWLAVATVSGQGPAYRAPRTADGKANLNGIWQAINSAHWDIEAHSAAPGVLNEQLGAAYSIPGGMGVVEGDLPYRPEALAKKNENFDEPAEARSRGQVLSARCARARCTCRIRFRSCRTPSTS